MFDRKIYSWLLLSLGIIIVIFTIYATKKVSIFISSDERDKVQLWADAIYRRAEIVSNTEKFYKEMEAEDRRRVNLLATASHNIVYSSNYISDNELAFYLEILENNQTIPVIITDEYDMIKEVNNVDFNVDTVKILKGKLKEEFSQYQPLKIQYSKKRYDLLYYKESKLFTKLRVIVDSLSKSFFDEVVKNSVAMPVMITDSTKTKIIASNSEVDDIQYFIKNYAINEPITVNFGYNGKCYIFYKNSDLLSQLAFFPYLQLGVIGLFILAVYIIITSTRRLEQDRVWVGMSRETAHQLGTPISSMLAWIELLRLKEEKTEEIQELNEISKDVQRLEIIAERFSKIGSLPKLETNNIVQCVNESVDYLKTRISQKVNFAVNSEQPNIIIPFNYNLMAWVFENISKNAVDAMGGVGNLTIDIIDTGKNIIIDFTDTGKGINRRNFKRIFKPGYTTKVRGWGLGLSLAKRIVNTYHKGKIFVKQSTIDKGTTFRIILKK